LVGDWVKDVDSFWASEEFGLDEIETIWVLLWNFGRTFWVWLLDSNVWLVGVLWHFIGSEVCGWVNHSFDGDEDIWSNLLIGDILVLGESTPVWSWCFPSVVVEGLWSSFPVKSFDFIVNEIVNVWFNSWLGNILLLAETLAWWRVRPSVDWISGISSGELWDWHHVLIGSDESDNFLIDVGVSNILGGSLVKSLASWGVGPSVDWIGGVSSSELWDWHHVLISSDESDDLLIDVGITDILGGSLVEGLACWSVRPSVNWISGISSSELRDWHHVLIGSDESDNFLINVGITDILGGSLVKSRPFSGFPSVVAVSGVSSSKRDWDGVLVSSDESNNFLIDVFVTDIVLVSLGKSRPFSGLESIGGVWSSFFLSSLLKWVIDGVVGEVVDRVVIFWLSDGVLFLHKSSGNWGNGGGFSFWSFSISSWGFGSLWSFSGVSNCSDLWLGILGSVSNWGGVWISLD
jgi:hypothetical protein